jgi:hypothetical protein
MYELRSSARQKRSGGAEARLNETKSKDHLIPASIK